MRCHIKNIVIADEMFVGRERDLMSRRGERSLQVLIAEMGKSQRSQSPESAVLITLKVRKIFHLCRRDSVRDIWQERFNAMSRRKTRLLVT
jgi:hypothetical protein